MYILAGDIGGTKTNLALFFKKNPRSIYKEKKYPSQKFDNLHLILKDFLHGEEGVEKACFGIAGPVENGVCRATNLPWIVDACEIGNTLKIPHVDLINDLEANAWGVAWLKDYEFLTLNKGDSSMQGNKALIAAGTGLGEAGFFWDGHQHHPFACEGGHCDFAPTDQEQIELWQYLRAKFDHVSYERILSGPGLVSLYQFFIDTGKERESLETKKAMAADNPSKVITEMALTKRCKACIRTLDLFVYIYGVESGNLALKFLSLGGLYIGGGIAPKIVDIMKSGIYMKGFTSKGRFAKILSQIPIQLILNENTALIGASRYASERK